MGWRERATPVDGGTQTDGGGGWRARARPAAEATGEPGNPGHDLTKDGPDAHVDQSPVRLLGGPVDAAKSFANKAVLGAGPQIAGAMGAVMHSFSNPMQKGTSDLDAYRDVRDETARELRGSENTIYGEAVTPLATLATPIPVKGLGPGASIGAKAKHGMKVGAGVGGVAGLVNSKADLTRPTPEGLKTALIDALVGTGVGGGSGLVAGGMLGGTQKAASSIAETQALRAAGLRGGIKNSVKKDLGLANMTEARQLGRQFLDEELIPPIGSSEAVAKRAEQLQSIAGNSKSSVLNEADVSGVPFDFKSMGNAARTPVKAASAPAEMTAGKANALADAFEAQNAKTPGSFVGADKAKSDAWKSANFADDAPMSAQLYRQATGAARDDIERQVAGALSPKKAGQLNTANKKYGVAADALKLAENASTRDAAKKVFGWPEISALLGGSAAGSATGHGAEGAIGVLALALGGKAFDKYGHSSAARASDFIAKRAAANTGGGAAGQVAGETVDALSPYLDLLEDEQP